MQQSIAPTPGPSRDPRAVAGALSDAIESAVRGAPDTVRLALVALLSGGHLLVEGARLLVEDLVVVQVVRIGGEDLVVETDGLQRTRRRRLLPVAASILASTWNEFVL